MIQGNDVARIRQHYGWTQEELSLFLQRSVSTVCRYETGFGNIPVRIQKLLQELDENGFIYAEKCSACDTEIKKEILSIVEVATNRTALLRLLTYARKISAEYPVLIHGG